MENYWTLDCSGITKPTYPARFATKRAALQWVKKELVKLGITTIPTGSMWDGIMELHLRGLCETYNMVWTPSARIEFHIRNISQTAVFPESSKEKEDEFCSKPDDMITEDENEDGNENDAEGIVSDVSSDTDALNSDDDKASGSSESEASVVEIPQPRNSLGKRGRATTGQLTVKKEKRSV